MSYEYRCCGCRKRMSIPDYTDLEGRDYCDDCAPALNKLDGREGR